MSAFPQKTNILRQSVALAHCLSWRNLSFRPVVLLIDGALLAGGCHMNEDLIAPWLMQYPAIWTALLTGLAPAMIANFKRRSVMRWYVYGFACSLVALPLVTLPTAHAFLLRSRSASPKSRQRQRRTDALALLAESSVRSYPTWIADLRTQIARWS